MKNIWTFSVIGVICVGVLLMLMFSSMKANKTEESKESTRIVESIDNTQSAESVDTSEPAKTEEEENKQEALADEEGATIELNGSEEIFIALGETFTDPGAVAKDKNGNDISNRIKVEGKVNTNQAGTYQIYYYVGKAIAIRTVTVG